MDGSRPAPAAPAAPFMSRGGSLHRHKFFVDVDTHEIIPPFYVEEAYRGCVSKLKLKLKLR